MCATKRWKGARGALWGLSIAAALASARSAVAQTQLPDPYLPWSGQYQQYAFPTHPTNLAIPNQTR
ncbi:MAG: hypothetical protein IRY99_12205, partial [Isosphaeraceae bacterium]|nr:hypothetical protein [Isosphaeraceae bacterium]